MDKLEVLTKIQQMSVAEKMARLTKMDFAYVENCIDQAILDDQKERQKRNEQKTVIDNQKTFLSKNNS